MSREAIESIIGKAVLDSEFREALFADPDQVLGRYDLSEEEVAGLKAIDSETMDSLAGSLDERISKRGGLNFYLLIPHAPPHTVPHTAPDTWAGLMPDMEGTELG